MLGLACALLVGRAGATPPDEGPGPLPWRVGGRVGFTVDAIAFPDTTGHTLDVFVRIPPSTLGALAVDVTSIGHLRLSARLRSGFGGKPVEEVREFEILPRDSTHDFGHVVVLRFPARPGPQRLAVRLEDTRSRKRGLLYSGRNALQNASVAGTFEVDVPRTGPDLSDIEFVWPLADTSAGTAFSSSGHSLVPNPERLYGLHADELRAHFVAHGSATDSRPWRYRARVVDATGGVVAERDTVGPAGPWLSADLSFDLTQEAAGGYALEVEAHHDSESTVARRRAPFSIAWRSEAWFRNPRDIEDAVHLLLDPDAEEAFARMHPGEQEHFLEEYWRLRDPTPGTAVNEAFLRFESRAAHANDTYTRMNGAQPGLLTDMGRTFVRYGEPSEILKQVIPAGDNTLSQALADLALNEDRPVGEVRQKGLGGDMRPFEVWVYEGDISPPVDADPSEHRTHRKRLVFLFVDEHGLGEYTLRYSTE